MDDSDPGPASATAAKPAPLDVDGVTAAIAGTVAFAIALVVLLVGFRDSLAASGGTWWIWVCVVGTVQGLIGIAYVLRRRVVYRAAGRLQ